MPGKSDGRVHVVVGVVSDGQGRVLLSRRPEHVHQGGLWEFPGGKREPDEAVIQTLQRELDEELGIVPLSYHPLIRIYHDYPDRQVLLDVWAVEKFSGQQYTMRDTGREGQEIRWVTTDMLSTYRFPAANRPIVAAARLPECYLITPEPGRDEKVFLARLRRALDAGIRLLRLRAWSLDTEHYLDLAGRVLSLCQQYQAQLLLSGKLAAIREVVSRMPAAGLHLTSQQLLQTRQRLLPENMWLAASCHNRTEMQRAEEIGVDFITLSPVLTTVSHPQTTPLGWKQFQRLCEQARLPVYALGGVSPGHLDSAWYHGASGVAAIRAFWGDPD